MSFLPHEIVNATTPKDRKEAEEFVGQHWRFGPFADDTLSRSELYLSGVITERARSSARIADLDKRLTAALLENERLITTSPECPECAAQATRNLEARER